MSPMTWEEYSRGQDAVAEGEAMAEMIQAVLDAHARHLHQHVRREAGGIVGRRFAVQGPAQDGVCIALT